MTDEQRSPAARARAEIALVRLLHEMGDEAPFLVVLGGLVPAVLARDTSGVIPEHLGTTDVDVLLVSHIDPDADLGVVERALEALQFNPDPRQDGWRWQGEIDSVPIRIEVRERYRHTSDIGPRSYAEQAIQVDPETPEAELRADAVDAVQRFFTALGLPGAP